MPCIQVLNQRPKWQHQDSLEDVAAGCLVHNPKSFQQVIHHMKWTNGIIVGEDKS